MILALTLAALAPAFDEVDGFRCALLAPGDLNHDGTADLVVAHRARPYGALDHPTDDWPPISHSPRIWALSGADGELLWSTAGFPNFGNSLTRVGDLDGDGVQDFGSLEFVPAGARIEAPDQDSKPADAPHPRAGSSCVVLHSGANGSRLKTIELRPKGIGYLTDLSGGLQVVGDETPDLLVGARGWAWLIDGATGLPVERYTHSWMGTVQVAAVDDWGTDPGRGSDSLGNWLGQPFGHNVELLEDLDGDGLAEVLVTGPPKPVPRLGPVGYGPDEQAPSVHRTHLVFSKQGRRQLDLDSAGWCAQVLPDLDEDGILDLATTSVADELRIWSMGTGELLHEQSWAGGYRNGEGTSLAMIADRDSDGVADLLVAGCETGQDTDAGRLDLLSTKTWTSQGSWMIHRDDDLAESGRPPTWSGLDATPVGDLDGDGWEELATMSPMLQEVRMHAGEDLAIRWRRSFADLLAAE